MILKEIETKLDSFQIYSIFKDKKRSFFLDSGMDREKLGQFSFIGFNPIETIKSKNEKIIVEKNGKKTIIDGDPFKEIKKLLSKYKREYSTDIPFLGGLVGHFSYDLCHHIERLPRKAIDDTYIPDINLGVYDGIVIIDHREIKDRVYISAFGIERKAEIIVEDIHKDIMENEKKGLKLKFDYSNDKVKIKSNFETKEQYKDAIQKVRKYIKSGDIYQVNLTQRFSTDELKDDPFDIYGKLRSINPAPFASYFDLEDYHIISSSPERFIRIKDNIIETRPIKGTINRGSSIEEDEINKKILCESEKDKAELLMIVDLERNDLGKIAKTGTVKVDELFHLEKYATVYHLVSTITAEIRDEFDSIDSIIATFPGGSITGAPKIRAMEIIDELEPTQRNIYTGSIGYIGFNGDLDLNIVIRTLLYKDKKGYFQVGGGITWDSDPELEYKETLHKAKAIMEALNIKGGLNEYYNK